jgi:hypothetical protein
MVAGIWAEFYTRDLPNPKQECNQSTVVVGRTLTETSLKPTKSNFLMIT